MRGEDPRLTTRAGRLREIPPRARRRLDGDAVLACDLGNTSACAEKTSDHARRVNGHWKYLRVRGEDHRGRGIHPRDPEIPPRARRRRRLVRQSCPARGNTSACAEKTSACPSIPGRGRKYLRVRGEDIVPAMSLTPIWEIPPRARRRHGVSSQGHHGHGNTSACAEKTRGRMVSCRRMRKYLRVRGEDWPYTTCASKPAEIPPRARRRPHDARRCRIVLGNTSACAEKTGGSLRRGGADWKYLRVRGEDSS